MVAIGVVLLLAFAFAARAAGKPVANSDGNVESFRESFDLRSTGQKQPLILRGLDGRATVNFGVPMTKAPTEAALKIVYRAAPAVQPEVSQIQVVLNGSTIASVPVQAGSGTGTGAQASIPLPADLLMPENTLMFQLSGRCGGNCLGASDASLTTQIDISSSIEMSGIMLPLANELRLLPSPFFEPSSQRALRLPFVFSREPDTATLEAAGVVASWFGVLADHRGVAFPVFVGRIPPGNVVVLTPAGSAQAAQLNLNMPGPAIAIRDNPVDPFGKVLAIVAQDSRQMLAAARALALGHTGNATADAITLTNFAVPPASKAYEAPRWLKGDRAVKVAEMVSTGVCAWMEADL
jgi:cellulose synthase (UDP-forming)